MNQDNSANQVNHPAIKIVETDGTNGQDKCPKCGSTDIGSIDIKIWNSLYRNKYGHNFIE